MNKCLNCEKDVKNKYCSFSCQNKHLNKFRANNKYGEFKVFVVKCFKCEKEVETKEREKLYPQKEKYFCSTKCSHSRDTVKTKEQRKRVSDTLKKYYKTHDNYRKGKSFGNYKLLTKKCSLCSKEIATYHKNQRFCSRSCAGKFSIQIQKEFRRSKNEMYFAELCFEHFKNVKTNDPIFNGWDADILLEDFKIAILWNGKWHYEKITKLHSVEQVQNRDKIKIKEIAGAGWIPYIIKDMGKFNKKFVKNKFEEFKIYLANKNVL